jgi:hypothetical protein
MLLLDSLWSCQTWIAQLLTHGQLRTEIDSRGLANYMYKYSYMFYVQVMTGFFYSMSFLNTDSVPFAYLMLFLRCGIR